MGEAIQECPGESFCAEDLGPFLKGQIWGDHEAMVLVSPADHLEEQFCPGFRERNIPQFIQDEQMKPLQLFLQAL